MENDNRKTARPTGLLIIMALSLGVNVILLILYFSQAAAVNRIRADREEARDSIQSLLTAQTDMSEQIEITTTDLDKYRGLSEELDSLLNVANADIAAKEARIKVLAKDA